MDRDFPYCLGEKSIHCVSCLCLNEMTARDGMCGSPGGKWPEIGEPRRGEGQCNKDSRGLKRRSVWLYRSSSQQLGHAHYIATLLLSAASVFLLQSHPHPIPNQMENGTLLSPAFEFPRS